MRSGGFVLLGLACLLAAAPPASAQSPQALLDTGVKAYRDLDFETAVQALRAALAAAAQDTTAIDRREALTYLGATELFRGEADSADSAFGRVVRLDPGYRPDPLIFPPQVTAGFNRVRQNIYVASVSLTIEHGFQAGADGVRILVVPSTFQMVAVEIQEPDGQVRRTIYRGALADTSRFTWDGLDDGGHPVAEGEYRLAVTSYAGESQIRRVVQIPLAVATTRPDTVPIPPPPADSLLLPERESSEQGIEALAGGVGAGLVLALAPRLVAPHAGPSKTRFGLSLAAAVVGVVGFVLHRPGQVLVANRDRNDALRASWRAEAGRIRQENAARLRSVQMVVRAGTPRIIEPQP